MTQREISNPSSVLVKTYRRDGCTTELYVLSEQTESMIVREKETEAEALREEDASSGCRDSRTCEAGGVLFAQVARR